MYEDIQRAPTSKILSIYNFSAEPDFKRAGLFLDLTTISPPTFIFFIWDDTLVL